MIDLNNLERGLDEALSKETKETLTDFVSMKRIKMNPMEIANELEDVYPEFIFKNHCYLRIAYDNVIQARWDTVVSKPFVKNANSSQVEEANQLLNLYKSDKKLLFQHHKISLTYRNKIK